MDRPAAQIVQVGNGLARSALIPGRFVVFNPCRAMEMQPKRIRHLTGLDQGRHHRISIYRKTSNKPKSIK
jgi:hypothetical protein